MEFHPCCMSYGNCDCDPRDAEIARLKAELEGYRQRAAMQEAGYGVSLDGMVAKLEAERDQALDNLGKVHLVAARLTAERHQLRAELEAERELADRLAECAAIVQCDVEDVAPDQVWEAIPVDHWNNLSRAIQDVRTRRNK